jgi:predicted neutral ceramidase superfamily lipid hydrolase
MHRTATLAAAIGIVGGLALVVTEASSTRGPLILLPYAGIVLVTALVLRTTRFSTLRSRVWTAMTTFIFSSLIFYGFVVVVDNPASLVANGLQGHAWGLAFIAAIGFPVATMLAYLTSRSGDRVG